MWEKLSTDLKNEGKITIDVNGGNGKVELDKISSISRSVLGLKTDGNISPT